MEKTSNWAKFDERSTVVFKLLLRVVIIIFAIFLILVIINGVRKNKPTVQAFEVPKSWDDAGLNGNTVAQLIVDKVSEIKEFVGSVKEDSTFVDSQESTDLEVNVMGVGLSLNSLSYYIKNLLNIPSPIIGGEVVEIDSTITLTMRMSGYPTKTIIVQFKGSKRLDAVSQIFEKGGITILENTDPYRVAVYHYRNKRYEESLKVIKSIISRNEKDVQWAYLAWANLLKEQGNKKESRKKLLKALEVDPDFSLANTNLAWILFGESDFDKSIVYFEKALSADENNINAYNGIAQCYRNKEDYDKAEEYYKKAMIADPTVSWIPLNYANMKMYSQKDTVGALALFEASKESVTDPIALNFALINILFAQGNKDSALVIYDEVLELDETNIHALASLSSHYFSDSLYDKSLEIAERFLTNADTSQGDGPGQTYRVYNTMSMSYYLKKEYEKSIAYAWKAIAKLPQNPLAYTSLAEAYFYWGKMDSFYKYIQKAFDLGMQIEFLEEDEPYSLILGDPRFKAIYEKDLLKN